MSSVRKMIWSPNKSQRLSKIRRIRYKRRVAANEPNNSSSRNNRLNEFKKHTPTSSTGPRTPLIYPLAFRTIPEALEAAPASQPFVTMWKNEQEVKTVTFGDFLALVSGQAAFLRERAVSFGDSVILVMPQGISLMAVFTAAMYLGAIPAILAYPNFKVDPSKYRFGLSGVSANLKARLVVVDDAFP
jgi:hypothetical protein